MAILVVLAFIAVTVAVGYALIRSQTTATLIEANSGNRAQAREAAFTGALYGLRQMHHTEWIGVGHTETVRIDSVVSADIQYVAGDAQLAADDPTNPYRVTIVSTGRVASGDAETPDTTYEVQLVVQLVPRALSSEPASWSALTSRTLTQWSSANELWIDVPAHVEGPAAVQGKLRLLTTYPQGSRGLTRYAYDLGQMAANGHGDYRPFSGTVSLGPTARNGSGYTLLTEAMAVPTRSIGSGDTPAFRETFVPDTYQLFAGGPTYSVPQLTNDLSDVRLQPDPVTNPLGVYAITTHITIGNNVRIDGVLSSALGTVAVVGENVELRGIELPPLADTNAVYALPTLATRNDLIVGDGASATFDGFALVEGRFEVAAGTDRTAWTMKGSMATSEFHIGYRTNWPATKGWWNGAVDEFNAAADRGDASADYFPEYVGDVYGYDPQPRIVIEPQNSTIRYHWQDWAQPVFVPHSEDPGLRWSVVRWQEG